MEDYPTKREAVLVLAITFLFLIIVSGFFSESIAAGRKEGFLAEVFVIIPALLFVHKKGYSIKKVFRLNNVSTKIILLSLLIGMSFIILSEEFERIIRIFFPLPEVISELEFKMNELFKLDSTYDVILLFISGVLMAGFFEEMLFRGFLLYSLEKQMDITKAVLITALVFAFVHYIWIIWPWYMVHILFFGTILGVLSWKSNSIYPAVSVHILHNIISIYYPDEVDASNTHLLEWKGHISPFIVLLAAYFIVFGFKQFYKSCEEYRFFTDN